MCTIIVFVNQAATLAKLCVGALVSLFSSFKVMVRSTGSEYSACWILFMTTVFNFSDDDIRQIISVAYDDYQKCINYIHKEYR